MCARRRLCLPLFVFAWLWLQPVMALAYIDPNTGGLLFQILAPVFAAIVGGWLFLRRWIAATLRTMWQRLTRHRPE